MSYGLTDDGFTAPRSADFLTLVRDAFVARASELLGVAVTVDWDADTFLGSITAVIADQLGGEGEALQSVYDAFNPANATGMQLDNLCVLVGVSRIPPSYSTVTQACTGTDGTVVRKGSIIEGGGPNGTTRWDATVDGTISGGTVDVLFQCEDAGVVTAEVGALTKIVTQVSGWSATTNAAKATPGVAREKDAELRKRRQVSLQTSGSRSLNALRANLLASDGVQAAVCIDNATPAEAVVQGMTLPASSVAIVLYPSTMTSAQMTAFAKVIYGYVAGGIQTAGAEVKTVTGGDGYPKTVHWAWASTTPVDVVVTVVLASGYVLDDVSGPVTDLVTDYFLALGVGDAARLLATYALVATVDGVEGATVTFNAAAVDLVPVLTELLLLNSCSVTE